MRVLILHHPRAGHGGVTKPELLRAFARAGHSTRYHSTKNAAWKRALTEPAEAVVAVGGDGTVARVAIALAKRRSPPPLTVIPTGKANNIARALGINATPARVAARLTLATPERLAIGVAQGPWGRRHFVESAGISPIAALLTVDIGTLRAGLAYLRAVFATLEPRAIRVRADGVDLSGRYVMVEALNIGAIGPRFEIANGADPSDDRLDLVLVGPKQLRALDSYLARLALGKPARCPIEPIVARRIEIAPWPAHHGGHVDDELWPHKERLRAAAVRIRIQTHVQVLVP